MLNKFQDSVPRNIKMNSLKYKKKLTRINNFLIFNFIYTKYCKNDD